MASTKFISVILPLRLEWTPCYSFSESHEEGNCCLATGDRVRVRFASKEYIGVVDKTDIVPDIAPSRILPVISVERSIEKIFPEEIELWKQVAAYYMCTIGEVYKAAYPVSKINLEEARGEALKKVQERRDRMVGSISQKLEKLKTRLSEKESRIEKTRQGTKALAALTLDVERLREEIQRTSNALETAARNRDAASRGILPKEHTFKTVSLTQAQENAFRQIREGFTEGKPVLLHGITGSGKTEIYIKAAQEILLKGKNVLYLVPEIALSRQLEERLDMHFGGSLLTFHSSETAASRRNTAEVIRSTAHSGNTYIVLGTRSSLFLPHNNLGLIIIDEEHDSSYKQDSPAPRYNGRDTALMLACIHKASTLLGSATPSLESLFNCDNRKYRLVELRQRFHGSQDSAIEIIDTKAEWRKRGMFGSISRKLADHIRATLSEGGQTIVLRSRRSWAPALQCEDCGQIQKCPHCNVSLSLHKGKDEQEVLRCHYCGYTSAYTGKCSICSGQVRSLGTGTQKIEEEIRTLFPSARIARLDSDTAQNRKYEEKTIKDFSKGELDILIGTQIVSKGFDFSKLNLVAVIAADTLLGVQDFRADEKAFQLLEQFRGRCGRRGGKGLFVIQTSQPEHPIYHKLIEGGTHQMDILMEERRNFLFPPFTRLIEINIKDIYEDRAERISRNLCKSLARILSSKDNLPAVIGPYAPAVDKIADNHLRSIRISLKKDKMLGSYKKRIAEAIRDFEKNMKYEGHITINVDPS